MGGIKTDTTFALLVIYAANVIITTPILIATLQNTRKIFAKKLNQVGVFLLLCHFSFSLLETIFRVSKLAFLTWPESSLALRFHALFTSLYMVEVQGGNVLLALERVKIITDSKNSFKVEVRVVLGMMAAECIAFAVVFAFASSIDGITPEPSTHYILWESLLVASYISTVTCVMRLYHKAYKFATNVLRETTAAIKSNRQASLIQMQTQMSGNLEIRQGPLESHECQDIDCILEAGIADVSEFLMQHDTLQGMQDSMPRTPAPSSRRISLSPCHPSDQGDTTSMQQHVPQAVAPPCLRPSCSPPYLIVGPHSRTPSTSEIACKPPFTLRSFLKPASPEVESFESLERKGERIRFERRLLVGCILMSGSLVGCYLPYMIYFLVGGIPGTGRIWDTVQLVSACDTVVTPLLTVYFQKDVRKALKDMVGMQFREAKERPNL